MAANYPPMELNLSQDEQRYQEEVNLLRSRRTQIGCWLTMTLVPAGAALDAVTYPNLFTTLLITRILCTACIFLVYISLFYERGKKNSVFLSFIWGIVPALTISWMILLTEGSISPFYAGLNLVILGTCVLLPFTGKQATIYCTAVYLSYMIACLANTEKDFVAAAFITHSIFILMTSIICITASYFVSKSRRTEFSLRDTLRIQNEQLTELDQMKNRFFANISHELRTPLTLIIAPLEEILLQTPDLNAALQDNLKLIKKNCERLALLFDDLLQLIAFDQGNRQIHLEPNDLTLVFRGVLTAVTPWAKRENIKIDLSEQSLSHQWILGDLQQLEQIFLNLFSNAIKFTPSGGTITCSITGDSKRILIKIADTGPGMNSDELLQIFDRFGQAKNQEYSKKTGLGIGLALVKDLIAQHQGQISVDSAPGKGTTFTLEFPTTKEPSEPTQQPGEKRITSYLNNRFPQDDSSSQTADSNLPSNKHSVNLLLVDDEIDMLSFMNTNLSKEYNVLACDTPGTALQNCQQNHFRPDVVVTDYMMPESDGIEFTHQLKQQIGKNRCKFLMVTARIDDAIKIHALKSGIHDFITKPFSMVELKARIDNLAQSIKLETELADQNKKLSQTLTKLKTTESQLIQSEKMNSLGTLASGLLHEINNPLNYTLMAASYADTIVAAGGPFDEAQQAELKDSYADVLKGLNRIESIITDLKMFANPDKAVHHAPFHLKHAIGTALQFTAHKLERIEVTVDIGEGLQVIGSQSQITQVFVNLLLNAADAIRPTLEDNLGKISIDYTSEGGLARIIIADNGIGMSSDVLSQIFDPFYTTKDVGGGTGLGLSVCHTILENHQSKFNVTSKPNQGSEFSFTLEVAKN